MKDARHHLETLYWMVRLQREQSASIDDSLMKRRLLDRALEEARNFLETEKSAPQQTIFGPAASARNSTPVEATHTAPASPPASAGVPGRVPCWCGHSMQAHLPDCVFCWHANKMCLGFNPRDNA
jgi:hypothetical protein